MPSGDESIADDVSCASWEDVEPAARIAFNVWVGQPELAWAKRAWKVLDEAGLVTWDAPTEYHYMAFRFLALAGIYSDFCSVAWDEPSEPDYVQWSEPLYLNSVRVGIMAARKRFRPDEDEDEDDSLYRRALTHLVDAARDEVYEALRGGFGGVSGLFVSLWRTNKSAELVGEEDDDDDEEEFDADSSESAPYSGIALLGFDDYQPELPLGSHPQQLPLTAEHVQSRSREPVPESDEDILNDVSGNKLAAYEWLESGCPPRSMEDW